MANKWPYYGIIIDPAPIPGGRIAYTLRNWIIDGFVYVLGENRGFVIGYKLGDWFLIVWVLGYMFGYAFIRLLLLPVDLFNWAFRLFFKK